MVSLSVAILCWLLGPSFKTVTAYSCNDMLADVEIKYIEWPHLEQCLEELSSESLPKNTSENIWRLIKSTFDGLENIPPQAYTKLGRALIAIPQEELRNISFEQVELVEAFGAVRESNGIQGFNAAQSKLLAKKIRNEWLGKNPKTYSEYDLISMGQLVCHLNVSDIEAMHPIAFREAAAWLGNIKNCPLDRLQAFAKLALCSDAFGNVKMWSKLDVSIIGNIINGLSKADIAQIDRNKLHLNQYFTQQNSKTTEKKIRTKKNSVAQDQNNDNNSGLQLQPKQPTI